MNPYKKLLNLLPGRPLQIATVLDYTDGVATLELLGGSGVLTARGEPVTIGDKVFVRDGAIEGPAPDLPEDTEDV